MKYNLIIIFLVLSTAIKAQIYEGTWHLIKKIEGNDTIEFDVKIKEGRVEELNFYSERVGQRSKNTLIEDSTELVLIGVQTSTDRYIDEEYEEEVSCPCFVYQSRLDEGLFFQLCESPRVFYRVELKSNELHFITLRKFNWRKRIYEPQNNRMVYIYTKILE